MCIICQTTPDNGQPCPQYEALCEAHLEADERALEVRQLARAFAGILMGYVGRSGIATINAENAKPENAGGCSSHDICDANVPMIEAFEETFHRLPDSGSQDDADMLNEAWTMAREAKFFAA